MFAPSSPSTATGGDTRPVGKAGVGRRGPGVGHSLHQLGAEPGSIPGGDSMDGSF